MPADDRSGLCARCEGPTKGQNVVERKGEHLHRHYPDCVSFLQTITNTLYDALVDALYGIENSAGDCGGYASDPDLIRAALSKANPNRNEAAEMKRASDRWTARMRGEQTNAR